MVAVPDGPPGPGAAVAILSKRGLLRAFSAAQQEFGCLQERTQSTAAGRLWVRMQRFGSMRQPPGVHVHPPAQAEPGTETGILSGMKFAAKGTNRLVYQHGLHPIKPANNPVSIRSRPRSRSSCSRTCIPPTLDRDHERDCRRVHSEVRATIVDQALGAPAYSEILKNAPSSPMIPRRNASTQIMKITPCVTVTQAPNCAR